MKKKLLLVLMLIAAVVVMPRVHAADAITLSKVEDITNEDTLQSEKKENTVVSNDDNSVITITYDEATFKLLEGQGDAEDKRPADKAWIGFRVALPEGAKKYEIKQDGKDLVAKTDYPSEEDKNVDVYYGFDADKLAAAAKEGKNLESIFVLNLYSEGEEEKLVATQTINVVVVPKGIVLQAKDYSEENKTEEWNAEKYEENIKKVTVIVKAMKDGKAEELPETAVTEYTLKEVYTLTEEQLTAIKGILTGENLELVGLYTDEELKTEFDATKALDADVTVYVAYKTKVEEPAPNTVDNAVMYIALAGVSLLVAGGIALYFKKNNE